MVTMKHTKGCARGLSGFNGSTGGEPNPDLRNRGNLRRLPGEGDRMSRLSEEDGRRVFRVERTAHVEA